MITKNGRQVLGRGLTDLIPIENESYNNLNGFIEIDVVSIGVNPFQTRHDFNELDIKGLAESIKNQGLIQPVVVRKQNNSYEIISGERRFRALKSLGKERIPCILKQNVSDNDMLEMALVENIQRENLNEIEISLAYKKLLFECGLSHQALSERVGKSRSVITNSLRLLKLPDKIQMMLRKKEISMGHARALLTIKNPQEQYSIAEKIIREGLTVRDIEHWYKEKSNSGPEKRDKREVIKKPRTEKTDDPDIQFQEEQLRYHFGTDAKIIMKNKNVGKIEIAYYNKSDLDRILNIILL